MEHISIRAKGDLIKYAELQAEQGYCFYDIDETDRQYLTLVSTPILNDTELARKFVVVQGDAEKLNEELQNEREKRNEQ